MVAVVPAVVGDDQALPWRHYLRGLWASGLRLGESLDLWWDRPEEIFPVFPRGGRPMLQVPGELEKGNADRLLPIAREFALFLLETPESARLMPAQLMELMRHESIDTTLRYYVGTDAQRTAEAAWAAYEQAALAVFSGPLPNSSPNSGSFGPPAAEPPPVRKSLSPQALPANGAAGTRTQDQRIKSPDDPDG